MVKFSLIVPCYNEASGIPALFERCHEVFQSPEYEVVLVDNGSTDHTQTLLAELLVKHPIIRTIRLNTNIGYGKGILAGLESAQGEILAWTHADLQTDPKDVLEGFKLFSQTRNLQKSYIKGLRYGRSIPDFFFAFCMSCFETLLFRKLLWDINAQPNIFSRGFYDTWIDPPQDFSLDLYVYFQAKKQRLNIIRFPVFFGLRQHGVSHWNISWQDKMKFIYRTFRYSLKLKRES